MKHEDGNLQTWQYVVAGAGAGAATRVLCQPLDVIKIRFQLQVEPISTGSKYSSMYQAARNIFKEEGVVALWSGHIPAQYLSILYGSALFWSYEFLKTKCNLSQPDISKKHDSLIDFACGAISGSFATTISYPFDTIRTRIVAEHKRNKVYRGVLHTGYHMFKTEGKLSLYKGLFPTIAQIAPHSGAQFMFYKLFSKFLKRFDGDANMSFLNSMSAGSAAGFLSKLIIYPFDLSKKRMQLQGFQNNRIIFGKQFYCRGFLDCVVKTIKTEGFFALYKGLYPSLIKAVASTSLHFAFYQQFCEIFTGNDAK